MKAEALDELKGKRIKPRNTEPLQTIGDAI
jgi:hypothetical protein